MENRNNSPVGHNNLGQKPATPSTQETKTETETETDTARRQDPTQPSRPSCPRFMPFEYAEGITVPVYRPRIDNRVSPGSARVTPARSPVRTGLRANGSRLRLSRILKKQNLKRRWMSTVKHFETAALLDNLKKCVDAMRNGHHQQTLENMEYKPVYRLKRVRRASVMIGSPRRTFTLNQQNGDPHSPVQNASNAQKPSIPENALLKPSAAPRPSSSLYSTHISGEIGSTLHNPPVNTAQQSLDPVRISLRDWPNLVDSLESLDAQERQEAIEEGRLTLTVRPIRPLSPRSRASLRHLNPRNIRNSNFVLDDSPDASPVCSSRPPVGESSTAATGRSSLFDFNTRDGDNRWAEKGDPVLAERRRNFCDIGAGYSSDVSDATDYGRLYKDPGYTDSEMSSNGKSSQKEAPVASIFGGGTHEEESFEEEETQRNEIRGDETHQRTVQPDSPVLDNERSLSLPRLRARDTANKSRIPLPSPSRRVPATENLNNASPRTIRAALENRSAIPIPARSRLGSQTAKSKTASAARSGEPANQTGGLEKNVSDEDKVNALSVVDRHDNKPTDPDTVPAPPAVVDDAVTQTGGLKKNVSDEDKANAYSNVDRHDNKPTDTNTDPAPPAVIDAVTETGGSEKDVPKENAASAFCDAGGDDDNKPTEPDVVPTPPAAIDGDEQDAKANDDEVSDWYFSDDSSGHKKHNERPPTVFTGEYRYKELPKGPTLRVAKSAENVIMGALNPARQGSIASKQFPSHERDTANERVPSEQEHKRTPKRATSKDHDQAEPTDKKTPRNSISKGVGSPGPSLKHSTCTLDSPELEDSVVVVSPVREDPIEEAAQNDKHGNGKPTKVPANETPAQKQPAPPSAKMENTENSPGADHDEGDEGDSGSSVDSAELRRHIVPLKRTRTICESRSFRKGVGSKGGFKDGFKGGFKSIFARNRPNTDKAKKAKRDNQSIKSENSSKITYIVRDADETATIDKQQPPSVRGRIPLFGCRNQPPQPPLPPSELREQREINASSLPRSTRLARAVNVWRSEHAPARAPREQELHRAPADGYPQLGNRQMLLPFGVLPPPAPGASPVPGVSPPVSGASEYVTDAEMLRRVRLAIDELCLGVRNARSPDVRERSVKMAVSLQRATDEYEFKADEFKDAERAYFRKRLSRDLERTSLFEFYEQAQSYLQDLREE